MEITERVKKLITDYLETNNIELIEITYRREQAGMVLRLLVDTPDGVKVKECEDLNNFLSEALDKEDFIDKRYILEVASPGLDRPIVSDRDFERSMGKVLAITTYESIDGNKVRAGKLIGMDKDNIVIEADGISTVIPRSKIANARQKAKF